MKTNKLKAAALISSITSLVIASYALRRIESYDFVNGLFIGLCGTAAAVWLVHLIRGLLTNIRAEEKVSIFGKNSKALLSFSISALFVCLVIFYPYSGNSFLSLGAYILVGGITVMNLIYAGRSAKKNICA